MDTKKILSYNVSNNEIRHEMYNTRIALWRLPYDKRFKNYDSDDDKWLESNNHHRENEIEKLEKELNISLTKYKAYTRTVQYEDDSIHEITKYPTGNVVKIYQKGDFTSVTIRDNKDRIVAEKYYNAQSNDGRKVLYKYYEQDGNVFTIVRIFSYDTTKNKPSDVINYGYTSLYSTLENGCELEKEYYLLNGKSVKVKQEDEFTYKMRDSNGKKLVFEVD